MAYQETLRKIKRGLVRLGAGGLLITVGCSSAQVVEQTIPMPSRVERTTVIRGDSFELSRFSSDTFLLKPDVSLLPWVIDANLARGATLTANACGGIKRVQEVSGRNVLLAVNDGLCFPELK